MYTHTVCSIKTGVEDIVPRPAAELQDILTGRMWVQNCQLLARGVAVAETLCTYNQKASSICLPNKFRSRIEKHAFASRAGVLNGTATRARRRGPGQPDDCPMKDCRSLANAFWSGFLWAENYILKTSILSRSFG